MASSDRGLVAGLGDSRSNLIALASLTAAIGFTPWAWGTGVPWAQFVFRALGLTALLLLSLGQAGGGFARSPREIGVTRCVVLFVLVSAASAVFSIHRGKSLEAMLNLLALTGLYLTAAMLVRGTRLLRALALIQLLAALPVAALGLLQYARPELLPADNPYANRVLGSFGQPNRLGGYLAAAIPVAVALSFAAPRKAVQGALLAAAFGLTLCLVATYSRGAWIGLAAGLLVLAAALARWRELRPRPLHLGLSLASVALPVLLLLPSVISRIESRPSAPAEWSMPIDPERRGSGAMRIAIWEGSLGAGLRRPVLGSGIGTFQQAYDRYKNPTMKRLEAEGRRTADHAHNHYLELFVECGVLGLAAFAAMVALSLGAAASAVGSAAAATGRVLAAGVAGSALALLTNGLLDYNLSLIPHGTLLFANLGCLAGTAGPPASPRRAVWAGGAGAVAAALAMAAAIASLGASRRAEAAGVYARMGRADLATRGYAAASALAPWSDAYAVAHAEQAALWADRSGGAAALREAEAAYRRAIGVNGSDPVTRHELARLYLAHRQTWGEAGVRSAIVQLRAALAQNPYYAEMQNDLGVALLWSGDRAAAGEAFRRATEGRREFVDPLLNLATLAIEAGNRAEAQVWLTQALERDPTSRRARELLARLAPNPQDPAR
jgi:O-antigen ligase